MTFFVGVLALVWKNVVNFFKSRLVFSKTLFAVNIIMALYLLLSANLDETIYAFDGAQLFWLLTTLNLCLAMKEDALA
jgi:hypothetical protein